MKTAIAHVHARRVFDSRGRPTVEAEVALERGQVEILSLTHLALLAEVLLHPHAPCLPQLLALHGIA